MKGVLIASVFRLRRSVRSSLRRCRETRLVETGRVTRGGWRETRCRRRITRGGRRESSSRSRRIASRATGTSRASCAARLRFRFAFVIDLSVVSVLVGRVRHYLVTSVGQQYAVLSGHSFPIAVGLVLEVCIGRCVFYLIREVEWFWLL